MTRTSFTASNEYLQLHEGVNKTHKMGHGELINKLCENYKIFGDVLTQDDIRNLTAKAEEQNISLKDALKNAIYFYLNPKKLTRTTNALHKKSQSADQNFKTVIDLMMDHNDKAQDLYDKIFITRYSIKTYVREHQDVFSFISFSEDVLKRGEKQFAVTLEKHHAKHNIGTDHNRIVSVKKRILRNA